MTLNLWNLMRTLSAFLLITAFLVLSNCPLRRTIQNLIKGTHGTEQPVTGRQVPSIVCQGIIDSSVTKFIIPEPKPGISLPVFTPILLLAFYPIWRLSVTDRSFVFQREFSVAYLNAVPIYLKNRILLI